MALKNTVKVKHVKRICCCSSTLPTNKKSLQHMLMQLCEALEEGSERAAAELALYEFLSKAPLSVLDFNETLRNGATIFAVLSSFVIVEQSTRCIEKILSDTKIVAKLNLNARCKRSIFYKVNEQNVIASLRSITQYLPPFL